MRLLCITTILIQATFSLSELFESADTPDSLIRGRLLGVNGDGGTVTTYRTRLARDSLRPQLQRFPRSGGHNTVEESYRGHNPQKCQ